MEIKWKLCLYSVKNWKGNKSFPTLTYKDMLRISLVSGLHTPRSNCSKLEIRATPDPVRIKIEHTEKNEVKRQKSVTSQQSFFISARAAEEENRSNKILKYWP